MSASESFVFPEAGVELPDLTEVDSLPSSTVSSDLEFDGKSDAQKEWEASLQQLELLLTIVVVPYIGKYLGRKCAYWSWIKYMEWMYPIQARPTRQVGGAAAL